MWYKGREADKVIEFCHPVWLFPWVNYLQITMTQLWQKTTATRHCKLEATLPSSQVLRILVARNGKISVFYTHTRGLCPATQDVGWEVSLACTSEEDGAQAVLLMVGLELHAGEGHPHVCLSDTLCSAFCFQSVSRLLRRCTRSCIKREANQHQS
jgi:hypothetical protein